MFSAHVDRHGLLCTGPNEFQYAAFVAGNRSDLLGNSVSEQLMSRVAGRFENASVMAYEPWSGAYYGTGRIVGARVCERRNNLIFEVEVTEIMSLEEAQQRFMQLQAQMGAQGGPGGPQGAPQQAPVE